MELLKPQLDAATAANSNVKDEEESPVKTPLKGFPVKLRGINKAKAKAVPGSIKRKRANYRLRKLIAPKSPILLLNEMIGTTPFTFEEGPIMGGPTPVRLVTAHCEVEGQVFSGTGPNRQIAKNFCAESVIQYIAIQRSSSNASKGVPSSTSNASGEDMTMEGDEEGASGSLKEENNGDGDTNVNPKNNIGMTDTPWVQLASLALFKMFNDWQVHGYSIPNDLMKQQTNDSTQPSIPKNAAIKSEEVVRPLPENPTEKHPVQLLHELRGPITYVTTEQRGQAPTLTFVMECALDGKVFRGEGRNKKEAKKKASIAALKELHGVVYPDSTTESMAPPAAAVV
ncbi:uncharacterized protein LOC131886224 isoform X1 [Tigriopus californicus]|uniref:uncharacterized protein LOC131886224 isoform X1 n=1 Tax=Tigriopus californicus TaxID=6832 RepID=UPI0027DAA04F|nr:uncharacterized protein LOC131886224 isoform X1 [Tigriopus californicus]